MIKKEEINDGNLSISDKEAMQKSCSEILQSLIVKYEGSIERLEKRCLSFHTQMIDYERKLKEVVDSLHKKISSYKGTYSRQISQAESLLKEIKNHMKEIKNEENNS